VGKSIVLNAALEALSDRLFRVIRLNKPDGPSWSKTNLIQQITDGSAKAFTGNPSVAALADLWDTSRGEPRTVIVVDDAHTLTDDAMELLLLTALPPRRRGRPPQLVLAGRGEFWEREWRGRLQSVTRLAERVTLRPLFGRDAWDFIALRLTGRGGPLDDLVSLGALVAILRHSAGFPDRLDVILAAIVSSRADAEHGMLNDAMVRTAIASLKASAVPPFRPENTAELIPRVAPPPGAIRHAAPRIPFAPSVDPAAIFARGSATTPVDSGLLVQWHDHLASAPAAIFSGLPSGAMPTSGGHHFYHHRTMVAHRSPGNGRPSDCRRTPPDPRRFWSLR
jgi:type II secretory pathway predicted ATPase ExeA